MHPTGEDVDGYPFSVETGDDADADADADTDGDELGGPSHLTQPPPGGDEGLRRAVGCSLRAGCPGLGSAVVGERVAVKRRLAT